MEVSEGGVLGSDSPTITITSSTGRDSSGPTVVSAAATAVDVGNYDVTISFSGTKLCAGDIYEIVCTAEAEGAYKTLKLTDDVPDDLLGAEVDLRLFIKQTGVELAKVRTVPTEALNWNADADGITVEGGIYLTDSSLTDDGDLVGVPLESATMFAHYRAWQADGAATPVYLNEVTDVETALGTVHKDNPLAFAVDKALRNTAGFQLTTPKVTAADNSDVVVAVPIGGDPTDTALWDAALEALESDPDAGQIVPLSTLPAVQALVKAHVVAQSADSVGSYRRAWLVPATTQTFALIDETLTDDEEVALATISATPATSPTKYTTFTCTTANAKFVTNSVREGDIIRFNYDEDLLGNETYDEYEVESVTSETVLLLEVGPNAAVATPKKFEIYRTSTKEEYKDRLVTFLEDFTTDEGRISVVWPNTVEVGGDSVDGTVLAAALAGLAGSVPSNQPLTGVGVAGIDGVARASPFFRPTQLNALDVAGYVVVSSDRDGNVYVRAANTPDLDSVNTKYEMTVRNADMVRHALLNEWANITGVSNNTEYANTLIDDRIQVVLAKFKVVGLAQELGAPVADLALVGAEATVGDLASRSVTVVLTGPVPLNKILLTLQVSN